MHFWSPAKENTVVLQLSIEGLPNAAVTVVESHCFGHEPLPWFLSKVSILCSAATIPGNGCCGWRKSADRSEWRRSRADDVNAALKGSFRCACTEWEWLATPAWPGQQSLCLWNVITSNQDQYAHSWVAGGRAGGQSVSCCLKICQRGTGNGQSAYIWQDRTTDSLSSVQKKLIRALPPWPHW